MYAIRSYYEYAFAYGADAVYAGQPKYSLRVRNNSFKKDDNLAMGIEQAHAQGKKFFVAANLFPHNNKVRTRITSYNVCYTKLLR